MKCTNIREGSYDCCYNIMPPFKTGTTPEWRYIAVDKCLIYEILELWDRGIRTTSCCCGHGDPTHAHIGVAEEDIPRMKQMGYEVFHNEFRPDDEDFFIPKTVLNYGEITHAFNFWDNNKEKEHV